MIDTIFRGFASLLGSGLGLLLIIVIGFTVMSGGRVNFAPLFGYIFRFIAASIEALFHLCGLIAETVSLALPKPLRRIARMSIQLILSLAFVAGALFVFGQQAGTR